jgi:hypothetical protein
VDLLSAPRARFACNESDRLKALKLLGKHLAMFKDVLTDDRGPTVEEMVLPRRGFERTRRQRRPLQPRKSKSRFPHYGRRSRRQRPLVDVQLEAGKVLPLRKPSAS